MSDVDRWVDSDDPEPEPIQSLPDTWSGLPSESPEEEAAMARQLFEKLDATLARRGEPKGAAASAAAPLAQAEGERQAVEEGLTLRSPTFDERAVAAPPAEPIAPAPPADAREAKPARGGAIEALKITMLALPIPAELREQLGRLPFKAPAAGSELARTLKVPVLNPKQGLTLPLGDDSIEKTVEALPFPGSKVGAAVLPLPRLSLDEYASLRAELSLGSTRPGEVLRRYQGMNEAARRALEEHWELELARSPEARAMFEMALADRTASLRAQRV
jgi:hypothetical protein